MAKMVYFHLKVIRINLRHTRLVETTIQSIVRVVFEYYVNLRLDRVDAESYMEIDSSNIILMGLILPIMKSRRLQVLPSKIEKCFHGKPMLVGAYSRGY